ncbi:MAG: hypothetical protein CMM01_08285 [Rhodopirellula sp.]|nr:hypothetical protein [Rhodopirellula sp.]
MRDSTRFRVMGRHRQDGYWDLLIWKPGLSKLFEAGGFVSGTDGEGHVMAIERKRPLSDGFGSR